MRIRKITADNFKSLVGFSLDLANFNCLIGLNGSGKSTVLQFIDFLAQQVRGDVKGWLKERSWRPNEIGSRLTAKKNVDFSVELIDSEGADVSWRGTFNTSQLRCTAETIQTPEALLEVNKSKLRIAIDGQELLTEPISFSYEGSVLSQLRRAQLPLTVARFRDYFASVKSLDLLSPEYLRQRTRESEGSLGLGGRKLSAFLYELEVRPNYRQLIEQLRRAYPQLVNLHTKSLQAGWKQLEIREQYEGQKPGSVRQMTTEARHVNDGMLRLIAILAELQSDHRFLLFDEIENGINPELIEFVLDALVSAEQQVLVTTHSPMILNYLSDEVAKAGVIYLYKTPQGATETIPFFSIPSLAEKLTVMGPGEAFVDTNLTALGEEIEAMPEGQ